MNTTGTVLTVGAGPAGMMAAVELSGFGIPCGSSRRRCDRPSRRAVPIQPRTLESLQQRGMVEKLIVQGNKVVAVSVYGTGKRVFRLEDQCVDSEFNYDIGPMVRPSGQEGVVELRNCLCSKTADPRPQGDGRVAIAYWNTYSNKASRDICSRE